MVNIANALDVPIGELLTDSLNARIESNNSELHRIILDCTAQEEKIITRMAQALKAILIEHGV